ncbi:DDE-type integrase/transposase/recombinase [Chroococcidiopsis sp [FACHB-1243]]|uniref:DDE-type integrase/transposase/recombinase n=1 Tax=Chroococcidiopsis sp. [FACHB-1243] TaxID=2692781 RepID=UPI00321FF9A4
MINVDKNAAYPKAIEQLKSQQELSKQVELRQNKYLNNQIEQTTDLLSGWSNQEWGYQQGFATQPLKLTLGGHCKHESS